MTEIIILGAGPAGLRAAIRAAELGARTTIVTSGEFGGMAANDGPIPVRTLAHAARLLRDAGQFSDYGIVAGKPVLDFPRLIARSRDVVSEVRAHASRRPDFDSLGIALHERTGKARFLAPHTIETHSGLRLQADKFVLCTGGTGRQLSVPGIGLTCTHSDIWKLPALPQSLLVVGGGDTGVQIASIFSSLGSAVTLMQAGPRILPTAEPEVSAEVATSFRASGIEVRENFGAIESFEKTPVGVRMNYVADGMRGHAEAALAVVAVGWVADTTGMDLFAAGIELNERGFIKTDDYLQTTARDVFAAGDVTGGPMLVPQALQKGYVAATNAVLGPKMPYGDIVSPVGSFTTPEYAQVGLTEAKARELYDVAGTVVQFDSVARAIIDGRRAGMCKIVTDRATNRILGCHIAGERAAEIVQVAAILIAAEMTISDLLHIPLSFPTYSGVLVRAAAAAARQLRLDIRWDEL